MHATLATTLLEISRDFADHRSRREESWYGYSEGGDTWGAIPFAVASLFRGQNARYSPMLPSISRGLVSSDSGELWRYSPSDQAKIVLRLAQSWWFSRELEHHPIKSHAASQQLDLDPIALAQHYGIPTGYLDLTDDFNVSAFFATCRETKNGWEPVETGIGVVYRVDLKRRENFFERYTPLGPQSLPRPTEQCAWITELSLCHSFEGWPDVSMMQFHHDRRVGEHYLEMFSGGEKLFPPDPLADVAAEILICNEIPSDLVERALESFAEDPHGIRKEHFHAIHTELGKLVSLTSHRRLLTDSKVAALREDSEWCERMLAEVKVKWQFVRRVPVQMDGGSDD